MRKTQPSYRTLTRAEKFVTQATERLILDGKEARIPTQIMTKTKVKYISDSLLILLVVLHKWQKLFCILLLSLCQKVSCGTLKEKEKKERKKEASHVIKIHVYSRTKLVKLKVPVNIQDNSSCIGEIVWNYTVREENKVQMVAFT